MPKPELGQLMGLGGGEYLTKDAHDLSHVAEGVLRDAYAGAGALLPHESNRFSVVSECYGCEQAGCRLCAGHPNFEDRETGVKVSWYKYPMRSATRSDHPIEVVNESVIEWGREAGLV